MSILRKPCEHGKYDEHHYWMKVGYMDYRDVAPCPGGELVADALVIEKVDGQWPKWALDILRYDVATLAECDPPEILDALNRDLVIDGDGQVVREDSVPPAGTFA